MKDETRQNTRSAIAVVNAAFLEKGDQKPLATQLAKEWLDEQGNDTRALVDGFVQLCFILMSRNTVVSPQDQLKFAAAYLSTEENRRD